MENFRSKLRNHCTLAALFQCLQSFSFQLKRNHPAIRYLSNAQVIRYIERLRAIKATAGSRISSSVPSLNTIEPDRLLNIRKEGAVKVACVEDMVALIPKVISQGENDVRVTPAGYISQLN